ncbi:PA14 domain-containing protein [Anaerolineales bacterium HSG6]|nr:PA14 domain-containing protein [Anaerolineales bacterium HSG6]MDM8529541.1 PA14 domain-containing protein [Anaerolineales bacterium HSG25]
MKKTIWFVLACLLFTLLPLTSQAAPSDQTYRLAWRAEYYNNPSLSGYPVASIVDSQISHDWGDCAPVPELPCDNFSVRWSGERHFDAGSYLFVLSVDDGARVWLNGQLIIDAWDVGPSGEIRTKIYFEEAGYYEIQIAYFDQSGPARIHFESVKLNGQNQVASAWTGEYFNNAHLSGTPALVRQDPAINYHWNGGSPDATITRDNFSVRWTRSIYLQEGTYTLQIQHEDGMRVYVDDKIIYDSWYDQPVSYKVRQVNLAGGFRNFRVEFYNHYSSATVRMIIVEDPVHYNDYESDPSSDFSAIGVVVDITSPRFEWHGPLANQYESYSGYNGLHFWTSNTNREVNAGRWLLPVNGAGNYEVYAYIPHQNSTTQAAHYQIFHFGEVADMVLNQSHYQGEWVSIGQYYFDGQGDEFVVLTDETTEAANTSRIAFDALKLVQR